MVMFVIMRDGLYMKSILGVQYPEWTSDIHKAYCFDQHAVHQAYELAELYEGTVCQRDMDTERVAPVSA